MYIYIFMLYIYICIYIYIYTYRNMFNLHKDVAHNSGSKPNARNLPWNGRFFMILLP